MNPIKPQSQMTESAWNFWRKFVTFILSRNISRHAAEWMIRDEQAFADNQNGGKLKDVNAAFWDASLDELG